MLGAARTISLGPDPAKVGRIGTPSGARPAAHLPAEGGGGGAEEIAGRPGADLAAEALVVVAGGGGSDRPQLPSYENSGHLGEKGIDGEGRKSIYL